MPKDADNCPYQPYPRIIETLKNYNITHIACVRIKFQFNDVIIGKSS